MRNELREPVHNQRKTKDLFDWDLKKVLIMILVLKETTTTI